MQRGLKLPCVGSEHKQLKTEEQTPPFPHSPHTPITNHIHTTEKYHQIEKYPQYKYNKTVTITLNSKTLTY